MILEQNTKDGMRKQIDNMRDNLKSMRNHLANVDASDKVRKYILESEMLLLMSIDEIKKIGVKEEVREVIKEVKEIKEDKEKVKEGI